MSHGLRRRRPPGTSRAAPATRASRPRAAVVPDGSAGGRPLSRQLAKRAPWTVSPFRRGSGRARDREGMKLRFGGACALALVALLALPAAGLAAGRADPSGWRSIMLDRSVEGRPITAIVELAQMASCPDPTGADHHRPARRYGRVALERTALFSPAPSKVFREHGTASKCARLGLARPLLDWRRSHAHYHRQRSAGLRGDRDAR
jgi:hypothetical protein